MNTILIREIWCDSLQPGAEFHADLPEPVSVLRKGTNPEVDLHYSFFNVLFASIVCYLQSDKPIALQFGIYMAL